MPPRGRKRRGKELVAAVATDAPGDAAVSPEYVEAVVAELEHESERRVKKLKRQMGDMRQEFLNHFQVELLKIPRKIREMKVEHFSSEYGGSMEEALKKAAQWEVEKVAPTPRRMTYDEVSPMPLWSAGVDLESSIGGAGDDMGMGFGMADDEPVVAALPPAKDAPLPLKATAAPKKKSRFSKTDVTVEASSAAVTAMAMDVDKPQTVEAAPQLPERMDVDESAPQADPNYGGGSCVDKMEETEWLRDADGKHCWLYWLDCVEQSGSVYLLGKIRLEGEKDRYASACCVVRNVERSFFVLPRVDPETGSRYGMKDVWEEARSELVRPRRPAVPSM